MGQRHRSRSDWTGPNGPIGTYISEEIKKTLEAYRHQPNFLLENANLEEDTARGGYAHRQLFELVQNSADALAGSNGGRVCIRLTSKYLYCADEGKPIDEAGARALMFSHLSSKRGTAEIGRFGLGFKSVIGVTDCPEFFSRSGSFRFDRHASINLIRSVVPSSERYPILRLPVAIDPALTAEEDPALHEFMGWATNIVRLPLKPGSNETLEQQITDFPQEFLLFVNHVSQLTMEVGDKVAREFSLNRQGKISVLKDGGSESQWLVISGEHRLSQKAKSDRRSLDDVDDIQVSWAIPVDRLDSTGHFWAFFPTMTTSPLAGILNAPWKTNEDRQNLLTGVYNNELIDFAAGLAAKAITKLQTEDDPARHLDALPRRSEPGDPEHFSRLRFELYNQLQDYELVPDQKGDLVHVEDVLYPPKELTDSINIDLFESWAAYHYRPVEWLHTRALTRNRLARLEFLYGSSLNHMRQSPSSGTSIPRQSISKWLEDLTSYAKKCRMKGEPNWQELAVEASTAAIQTAVLIDDEQIRNRYDRLGSIILTSQGKWVTPDPSMVFLSEDTVPPFGIETVHLHLYCDSEVLLCLRQLGLQYLSPEVALNASLSGIRSDSIYDWNDDDWVHLWEQIRSINQAKAANLIKDNMNEHSQWSRRSWHDLLHVRTCSNYWSPLSKTLLPGSIVPEDGSRDSEVAIDLNFHDVDVPLLQELGATDIPTANYPLSSDRYFSFLWSCRTSFIQEINRNPNINRTPQEKKLEFISGGRPPTSGPLDVFGLLSEESKLLYTERLLDITDTYRIWEMGHSSINEYGTQEFQSPAVEALLEYGKIQTERGISDLWEGLSPNPDSLVIKALLRHPSADRIVEAFQLCVEDQISVEAIGEDEPIPLIDIWPGFKPCLSDQQMDIQVVRCDELLQFRIGTNDRPDCLLQNGTIYVVRKNEEEELQQILEELKKESRIFASIRDILEYKTPEEVEQGRARVRECVTDEERLLAAVGETALRQRLPWGLLEIMEQDQGYLTGVQIAQAAIATFHTGALREYRHELDHLGPPGQWAGSSKAVRFVQSLGFGEDWAGGKKTKRTPYVEVVGPYSLPPLHGFQRIVVDNVKELIRSREDQGEGRGMISMPTGSGKTRVAVQAIVEAIRESRLRGNILWVADRDELCEQAVEAWTQVWSSEGIEATQLRISRMWGGQPNPLPTEDIHVVIASVQTIYYRIADRRATLEFLTDLKLLVFDEAHRSIAHSHTTVMKELGLDRRRRSDEPILIGLTATPYRGHNQQETERLVNRYGKNRLDAGAFSSDDPEKVVQELQTMNVLAKADHATIEGGEFRLSHEELQESEKTPYWLPRSVENRIAGDSDRTRRIVQAYLDRTDHGWPTLIYATSVEHSQVIAALLVTRGVEARAVSASTDTRTRRRTVEEFRNGEIKVLVNYGIFREGFDAPKTRAVIIARPVYSPNLYFQMIGRGLRGVKNGGNDRCLILDVDDNVVNFRKRLAFSDLDWLWDWDSSVAADAQVTRVGNSRQDLLTPEVEQMPGARRKDAPAQPEDQPVTSLPARVSNLSIPSEADLLYPTVCALRDLGGSGHKTEIDRKVIEIEGFGEELMALRKPNGISKVEYRLGWVRTALKGIGVVVNMPGGYWSLTEKGLTIDEAKIRSDHADYRRRIT